MNSLSQATTQVCRNAHKVDVRHAHARVGQRAAIVAQPVRPIGDEVVRRDVLDVGRNVLGPRCRGRAAAEHVAAELVARLPRCAVGKQAVSVRSSCEQAASRTKNGRVVLERDLRRTMTCQLLLTAARLCRGQAAYARVRVDVVEDDRDVVLEDGDDLRVAVELAAVVRVGAGPPGSAAKAGQRGHMPGVVRRGLVPDEIVLAAVICDGGTRTRVEKVSGVAKGVSAQEAQ